MLPNGTCRQSSDCHEILIIYAQNKARDVTVPATGWQDVCQTANIGVSAN